MLAGDQSGQIAAPLLGIAVTADLVDAQIGMRPVGQADRGRGARDLLHGEAMGDIAEARAAVLFLDRDAVQADRSHLRPQIAWEEVVAVDRGGARRDLLLGESVDRLAQMIEIGAETEVQPGPCVGNHQSLLATARAVRAFPLSTL